MSWSVLEAARVKFHPLAPRIANAYPCPNRFSSCETEHVLRATLAPLSNIFCSPTRAWTSECPKISISCGWRRAKSHRMADSREKTAAGINYNYILTKLRSQNAFFTPFKHPLPDDSQRGHPIAPNQTAGTTSQSWTVGKQRPPENIIHIIKQKQALRLLRFTLPSQPSIFSPPPSLSSSSLLSPWGFQRHSLQIYITCL